MKEGVSFKQLFFTLYDYFALSAAPVWIISYIYSIYNSEEISFISFKSFVFILVGIFVISQIVAAFFNAIYCEYIRLTQPNIANLLNINFDGTVIKLKESATVLRYIEYIALFIVENFCFRTFFL